MTDGVPNRSSSEIQQMRFRSALRENCECWVMFGFLKKDSQPFIFDGVHTPKEGLALRQLINDWELAHQAQITGEVDDD